jgi:hypothetical protein
MSDITRKRGDTYPIEVAITADGTPLNITGASFVLTVDPRSAPVDDTQNLFALTADIVNAATGLIEFPVTLMQSDNLGKYYYDIQMLDAGGIIRTIAAGRFTFVQDITKV